MDARPSDSRKKHHYWKWIGIAALVVVLVCGFLIRLVISRSEPIVRQRVIASLSSRFQSKVELNSFHVLLQNGIEVSGGGLKIFGKTDPNPYQPGVQPLINVDEFRFHTPLRDLFRSPMHVQTVFVKGLSLNIPPKQDRGEIRKMDTSKMRLAIVVDNFICENTKLLINNSNPDRPPMEIAISGLTMRDVGRGQPMQFHATLINPKPVGDIDSTGLFGPLESESPRDTPVQGNYSFSNADLGTIKGIGGILSSTGDYSGTLGNIVVHGTTDTPDFRVDVSGHAVPLHTEFHAVVDGITGDTYLRPVNATVLKSSFTASGSIVRKKEGGHQIDLEVNIDHAQIEDLLQLGVRTEPPIMTGPVQMKTSFKLEPGNGNFADRLKMAGTFDIPRARFNNPKIQGRLDSFSLRSQGKPKEAKLHDEPDVSTELQGNFSLDRGVLSFSFLHFLIPGTHVDMTGDYSLDGKKFDFHGTARLDAKLSQMTTGWKSLLLKPVDPFFSKKGAGTEVPIRISGTESEPHFGLDLHRKSE